MAISLTAGLVVAGAVAVGAVVKGSLGVGFPVVATPLIALALDPETAVVAIVIPSLLMNGVQAWQGRRFLAASDPLVRLLVPTLGTVVTWARSSARTCSWRCPRERSRHWSGRA